MISCYNIWRIRARKGASNMVLYAQRIFIGVAMAKIRLLTVFIRYLQIVVNL